VTRRIALLLAVLAAPIVVVLGSMLAGRYYYGSLAQAPSPSLQAESSASVMPTAPTESKEETTVPVMPTRPTERIELDGIRNGKIAFTQESEMPSALEQAEEQPGEPILVREPDIWTVNPNGSNRVQLTANSRDWDEHPAWSPDGERIAYVNKDPVADQPNLAGRIYIMDTDGSDRIKISPPHGENAWSPTWSPDGRRIAFSSTMGSCGIKHCSGYSSQEERRLGRGPCPLGQETAPPKRRAAYLSSIGHG
jgi:hypothetical protein